MKQILLFILFTQIAFGQNNEINKLLSEGGKAFTENNYLLAKEIYYKATELNPKDKDCWYNLAASELKLGDKENACEHFYKAYSLNDVGAVKEIEDYCPNFRNGTFMSIADVEEKPKFLYEGKEYPLFENKNVNQVYSNILINKMKKSNILSEKLKGKVYVQITTDNLGYLVFKIIRAGAEKNDTEIVKNEMMSILKNLVTYIPAKNKGINVELWDRWILPIDFGK